MRFRKFALRGLIVLAVVVALCVLFSGTIRSLTTPKVRYAPVRSGKFENVSDLTGKVVFPEVEDIRVTIPDNASLTVTRVLGVAGRMVREGETLLTAEVLDLDKTLASLRADYTAARDTLDAWNRKNSTLRLTRNEQLWQEAYEASREAEQAEREARIELLSLLKAETLPTEMPEDMDEETAEAYAAWQKASESLTAARAELQRLDRYAIPEDTWTLLKSRQEAEEKMADAESQMTALMLLSRETAEITAPHDGYISEVFVEKGGVISGETVVMKITAEKQDPVIRVDISGIKQTVKKGTAIQIPTEYWGNTETRIINTGVTSAGHPFADAEITQDVIYGLGQVEEIMKEDVKVRLSTRAQDATCLVPASAVRGSGEGRYVYIGDQVQSAFEGNSIKVQKMSVTVLAESASIVSISEDLTYYKVLYMEDRTIEEGGTVMLYEE